VNGIASEGLERIPGELPVLIVAPHAGRRPPGSELTAKAPRKANDLGTGEMAMALARRTGAAAIVNSRHDRNVLDLNRVSHVRRHARGLFDFLLEEVRRQIERRGEAWVFAVHGWNAIQRSCEIGVGGRLAGGRLVPVRDARLTVPENRHGILFGFAAACERSGIGATFGERYPAAAKDNLLQVFTERYADDPDPAVRELARLGAAGRVCAVQLELAVPLRWPGPWRESFLAELARFVAAPWEQSPSPPPLCTSPRPGPGMPHQLFLEFHDDRTGIGAFAGIEHLSSGRRRGRLLLCLGRSRLALFTGEETRGDPLWCAGLVWELLDAGSLRLSYEGPALVFPRTDSFLDLESGLAEARLTEMQVELRWQELPARRGAPLRRTGRVTGRIAVDGMRVAIEAFAALDRGSARIPAEWLERRVFHAALGEDLRLSIVSHRGEAEVTTGELVRADRVEPVLSARIDVLQVPGDSRPSAWRVDLVSPSGPLRLFGHVTTAVPVVRPHGASRHLTWFGLARVAAGSRSGSATFELARMLDHHGLGETPSRGSG
jgi:hypothetical protein